MFKKKKASEWMIFNDNHPSNYEYSTEDYEAWEERKRKTRCVARIVLMFRSINK